jgi:hypothetical protein
MLWVITEYGFPESEFGGALKVGGHGTLWIIAEYGF